MLSYRFVYKIEKIFQLMLAGSHIILGNTIALKLTQKPVAAFLIGLISHHILDAFPHLDGNIFSSKYKIPGGDNEFKGLKDWPLRLWLLFIIEFIAGSFLFLYFGKEIIAKNYFAVLSTTLGVLLPDAIHVITPKNLSNKFKLSRLYLNFHKTFHYIPGKMSIKQKIFAGTLESLIIVMSLILLKSM